MSGRIEEIKKSVEEQRRKLESLRTVVEGEGVIGELRKRVGEQCEVLGSLGAGLRGEGEGFALSWPETRHLFLQYVEFKKYNPRNAKCMISYMDRFVREPIRAPLDVMKVFTGLSAGQSHNLNRALSAWLRCLEINNPNAQFKEFLNSLRAAIPKDEVGFDLKIPTPDEVASSLKEMTEGFLRYRACYELVLDSGLRLVEACRLINSLIEGEVQPEMLNGFCVAPLGYFRRTKLAYFAYFTDQTLKLIKHLKTNEKVTPELATNYVRKRLKAIAFKYLRKFANDIMTSEKLNIPESVADFIQGRVPRSIGAKHYMRLKRKADQFYPRYAEYVTELRRKAGTLTA
jgi:intergrase/recombinase